MQFSFTFFAYPKGISTTCTFSRITPSRLWRRGYTLNFVQAFFAYPKGVSTTYYVQASSLLPTIKKAFGVSKVQAFLSFARLLCFVLHRSSFSVCHLHNSSRTNLGTPRSSTPRSDVAQSLISTSASPSVFIIL